MTGSKPSGANQSILDLFGSTGTSSSMQAPPMPGNSHGSGNNNNGLDGLLGLESSTLGSDSTAAAQIPQLGGGPRKHILLENLELKRLKLIPRPRYD